MVADAGAGLPNHSDVADGRGDDGPASKVSSQNERRGLMRRPAGDNSNRGGKGLLASVRGDDVPRREARQLGRQQLAGRGRGRAVQATRLQRGRGFSSDFDDESNAGDGDSLESYLDDESGTDDEGSLMILEENVAYLSVCQILFQLE